VAQLLVVEDDDRIGRLLETGLHAHGYDVRRQRTGRGALTEAASGRTFDLVVLDIGLPDMDGVEVCRELRLVQPATIIVMLTARRDEMDVVAGLESGADDYLTKPFGMVELLARLRAHLRRAAPAANPVRLDPLDLGSLHVHFAARKCLVGDVEVSLRGKEYDLLARLAEQPGTAVSREALMADVWDENWWGSTKTLDVHIAALRRKLSEAAASAAVPEPTITTLRGHGYRLEDR
jgi:DNA-binding response OmpR family regulator